MVFQSHWGWLDAGFSQAERQRCLLATALSLTPWDSGLVVGLGISVMQKKSIEENISPGIFPVLCLIHNSPLQPHPSLKTGQMINYRENLIEHYKPSSTFKNY